MRRTMAGRLTTAAGAAIMATGVALAVASSQNALANVSDGVPAQVPLRQSNVFANDKEFDQGFGECTEVMDQDPNEDVWVFVWPGNVDPDDVESLLLNFGSDGDDVADETRTRADATGTTDQGTAKFWVTTPAGWLLVDGTSTVGGMNPPSKFNLTHSCAGGAPPGETTPPGDETSPPKEETPPEETTPPVTPPDQEKPGLPVTGISMGTLLVIGGGMLLAGIALLATQRRRDLIRLLENS